MSAGPLQAVERAVEAVAAGLGLVSPEVTPLAGGLANRALRLRDATHDVVLRIAGPAATALGANRGAEAAMQALAAGAGLAPAIVLSRPEAGLLVTRFAPGRGLSREDMHEPATLARIGRWIAALQELAVPPGLPVIDLGARAAACLATLAECSPSAQLDELARRLRARREALPPGAPVACHHDLHHRNLIDAGADLLAVDWEYAGPGDAAADLAACIGYHGLGPREVESLLAGYGMQDARLRARLAPLGWIFDCLWFGWNAVAARAGLAPEPGLQERLAARLLA